MTKCYTALHVWQQRSVTHFCQLIDNFSRAVPKRDDPLSLRWRVESVSARWVTAFQSGIKTLFFSLYMYIFPLNSDPHLLPFFLHLSLPTLTHFSFEILRLNTIKSTTPTSLLYHPRVYIPNHTFNMGQSAAVRRGNERFAKREDAKRGKANKKQAVKEKSPISNTWLIILFFLVAGGGVIQLLRLLDIF